MALNAVQKEVADTLKRHPDWTKTQAIHWNRQHNPATIARHKKQAKYEKAFDKVHGAIKNAEKISGSMKANTYKRIKGVNALIHKGADNNYEVIYKKDKDTIAIHKSGVRGFRYGGDILIGSNDRRYKRLAGRMERMTGSHSKHSSSGRNGH